MTDGWKDGKKAAVLRGGANARAVLEVLWQSGVRDLQIYHIEERIPELEDIFLSTVVDAAHTMFDTVNISWRRDPSLCDLVREIGPAYSMLFFGAPLAYSETKPLYEMLKSYYAGSITIVRGLADEQVSFDAGDEISKWVRGRTFDAGDFSLPALLRGHKRSKNLSVGVVLPSLNEEQTVGKVIKAALEVKAAGIIDELLLMDSGSTDSTRDIAAALGIPVYTHFNIRPDLGRFAGKGEAMFKSAFVCKSDILAWVDTDIETITPGFFYGLLGPLLVVPGVKFAKGYFARPVRVGSTGVELGGGRVTEIMAKPWINTFLPQLSGYIQPLAGTVAICRELLMTMRIPTNYGVEVAMLVQAVEKAGLWSTCQVNLGEVVHRSKDVVGLSAMAFQIMQVFAELGKIQRPDRRRGLLRRVYSAGGRFEIGFTRHEMVWRDFGALT